MKVKSNNKIFIQVKGIGFTFFLDKGFMYSLINPSFLSFFREEYPATEEEYQANQIAVERLMKESKNPFIVLPEHLKMYFFRDVYKEVGSKVVRCSDNKLRNCKAVKFNFEYEGHSYSELFFIDKSIEEGCAILVSSFWSKFGIGQSIKAA